jgi:hypothetical protein
VWIEYRVNIYKSSNILFSRNSKIFKEGLEQADYVVEKYYDENNFQYVSYIGEIKPVGKPTRLYQLDLYWIPIFSKQQIVKKKLNKFLLFLCVGNYIKFYCMPLLNDVCNLAEIAKFIFQKSSIIYARCKHADSKFKPFENGLQI